MKELLNSIDLSKSPPEEKALLYAYVDMIAFGRMFLSGDFKKKPDALYQHIVGEEINSRSMKPCAIILPRSHAKSTIVRCSIVHDMCYHRKAMEHFAEIATTEQIREFWIREALNRQPRLYAWVAKSQTDSMNNIRYVNRSLRNPKIAHFFGVGQSFVGEKWTTEDIITSFGDRLISASNVKSIRGFSEATETHGAVRFYRVFADDFENEENTKTFLSRESIKNTLLGAIIPAIENAMLGARLFLIGTPVHFDALIQNILDEWNRVKDDPVKVRNYPWAVLTWKATQPDMEGGVLWNGGMPREELERRKAMYRAMGKEHLYYQEYELEVQSEDKSRWTRKHIKYHKGVYRWDSNMNHSFLMVDDQWVAINCFIGCDPATDIDTENADLSSIMVIGIDINTNVYVLEYEAHKDIPTVALRDKNKALLEKEGVIDIYLRLYDKYHCLSGVIEDVAMNRSVFQAIRSGKANPESIWYNRWDVRHIDEKPAGKGSKRSRIYSRLSGRFADGRIHVRENHDELVDQILMFGPRMAHDDILESLDLACLRARPPREIEPSQYGLTPKRETLQKKAKSWIVS